MERKPDQHEYVKSKGFDSIEEWEFGQWCEEAKEIGLLDLYLHHPPAFPLSERKSLFIEKKLKTKTKMVEIFLLHPHEYTTDYQLHVNIEAWNKAGMPQDPKLVLAPDGSLFCDIKGGFSPYHDAKQFAINQKWVMEKYAIYINKIVPEDWFRRTFVPQAVSVTWKTGKIRDKYRGVWDKASVAARLI